MLELEESTDALLSRVLAACRDTERLALELARGADRASLQRLLQDRAENYRVVARDLQRNGCELAVVDSYATDLEAEANPLDANVDRIWEAIECSTLITFRDALDADLPPAIDAIVRRCIEDGVSALERLRSLPQQ